MGDFALRQIDKRSFSKTRNNCFASRLEVFLLIAETKALPLAPTLDLRSIFPCRAWLVVRCLTFRFRKLQLILLHELAHRPQSSRSLPAPSARGSRPGDGDGLRGCCRSKITRHLRTVCPLSSSHSQSPNERYSSTPLFSSSSWLRRAALVQHCAPSPPTLPSAIY